MFNKDSVTGTFTVTILLSLLCSIVVASSAVLLKPRQIEQKQIDTQQNILNVAGLMKPNINIKEVFDSNIEARLVDLDTGEFVPSQPDFSVKAALNDPEQSKPIPQNEDLARIRQRANLAEVYLVKNPQGKIDRVIVPIYGRGLWSTIYGFVAIQSDGNTIEGITYYDHGETAGLGGEITNPTWLAQFPGKMLYKPDGTLSFHVSKGGAADKQYGVDAISGATLTSTGVGNSFKYWFGQNGFRSFLEKLKAGELNNG